MNYSLTIFLSFYTLFLVSWTGQPKQTIQQENEVIIEPIIAKRSLDKKTSFIEENAEDEYYDFSKTVLAIDFTDSTFNNFSNSETTDLFTFFVPKGNINETTSILKIFDNSKNIIYEVKFKTRELVNDYDMFEIENEKQMIAYVFKKAKDVFSVSTFVDFNNLDKESYMNDVPVEDYINYDILQEIKKEKRYVFVLAREQENIIYFGYDRKKKSVVEIYTCCWM